MSDHELPESLLQLLQEVDTPTVCNAIEVAQGSRGFDNYSKGTMLASDPQAPAMVGFARTAKIAGRQAPTEPKEVIKERRLEYFRHMAGGPRPAVVVIEDVDYPDCVSAWWGEVHTTVHHGLGLKGALTNGVMRDLGDLQPGFPVVAASIGPSHAFVHVREIGTPVNVMGVSVNDGDLVHADRHGALVVPPDVIGDLERAIRTLLDSEHLILGPAREPGFTIEKLEAAWRKFEAART